MSELNYLDYKPEDLIERPLWWQEKGLSYTTTGYGRKIPTAKMIKDQGRLKRVYCCIYSNIGTCYILRKGVWWILSQPTKPAELTQTANKTEENRQMEEDMQRFIADNRGELDACIRRATSNPNADIDDDERELWINNDEGLYLWAKAEGVDI